MWYKFLLFSLYFIMWKCTYGIKFCIQTHKPKWPNYEWNIPTTKYLHRLFDEINHIHPTLKFTMEQTTFENEPLQDRCDCQPRKSIPFLDTFLSLENGNVEVDLYKKQTSKNQYLVPLSCHPGHSLQSQPENMHQAILKRPLSKKTERAPWSKTIPTESNRDSH